MQCYIDCDVFLLQDNQYQFFQWCDPELCQRAKVGDQQLDQGEQAVAKRFEPSLKKIPTVPYFAI